MAERSDPWLIAGFIDLWEPDGKARRCPSSSISIQSPPNKKNVNTVFVVCGLQPISSSIRLCQSIMG